MAVVKNSNNNSKTGFDHCPLPGSAGALRPVAIDNTCRGRHSDFCFPEYSGTLRSAPWTRPDRSRRPVSFVVTNWRPL
jgi:hypothetical protein